MTRDEMKSLLPHREPMLLLDTLALEDGAAVGCYTVRGDEFFLQGHFPQSPVVPGVILCEMMGQAACVLVEAPAGSLPYFTGMDGVKFRRKVLPGETVTVRSVLTRARPPFYFIKAESFVADALCAQAQLSFAVLPEEK